MLVKPRDEYASFYFLAFTFFGPLLRKSDGNVTNVAIGFALATSQKSVDLCIMLVSFPIFCCLSDAARPPLPLALSLHLCFVSPLVP